MGQGTECMERSNQSFITSNTEKGRTRQVVWRTSGRGHQTSSKTHSIFYFKKGDIGEGSGLKDATVPVWNLEDDFQEWVPSLSHVASWDWAQFTKDKCL